MLNLFPDEINVTAVCNHLSFIYFIILNFRKDKDNDFMDLHVLSPDDGSNFLNVFIFSCSSSFNILFILMTAEFMNLSVLAFFF